MKKIIALLTAVLLLTTTVFATDYVDSMKFSGDGNLTLEQAIELAMKNNPDIAQADLNVKIVENANYTAGNKLKNDKKKNKNLDPKSLTYQDLIGRQEKKIVFDLDKVKRDNESTIRKVKTTMETLYFTLMFNIKVEEIYKDNLKNVQTIRTQTKQKYDLGTVSKQEVLSSELAVTKAQNDLENASKNVASAKMVINTGIGRPVMSEVIPNSTLDMQQYDSGSIAVAVGNAVKNSSSLKNQQYALENARLDQQLAAMGYTEGTPSEIDKALKLKQAELSFQYAVSALEVDVRNKYMDLTLKKGEIERNKQALENAKEAYRISQVSYEAGVAIQSAVDNAQNAYLSSAISLWTSILNYNLSITAFQNAVDGF